MLQFMMKDNCIIIVISLLSRSIWFLYCDFGPRLHMGFVYHTSPRQRVERIPSVTMLRVKIPIILGKANNMSSLFCEPAKCVIKPTLLGDLVMGPVLWKGLAPGGNEGWWTNEKKCHDSPSSSANHRAFVRPAQELRYDNSDRLWLKVWSRKSLLQRVKPILSRDPMKTSAVVMPDHWCCFWFWFCSKRELHLCILVEGPFSLS